MPRAGAAAVERRAERDRLCALVRERAPQGGLSVEEMCRLAGLSRATYHRHWHAREPRREECALRDRLQQLALAHRRYGHRRLCALLRREGRAVNRKRVLRLLREDNLLCLRQRAFVPATTDAAHRHRVWPNLARHLPLSGPDQLWVADLTYVRLAEEFAYLAVVLDAHSRKVVGWALETHLQASLPLAALARALASRQPAPGLVHHSDRGVQYACGDYIGCLEAHGVQPSMSRIGCPYDNAKAESFMATLKAEEVSGQAYRDASAARSQIGHFIEEVYNRTRLHSALGYRSPDEWEQEERTRKTSASSAIMTATCP